jgi:hypothetical protein
MRVHKRWKVSAEYDAITNRDKSMPEQWRFIQGDQMSLWKNRPKCSQTHFCQNQCITLTMRICSPKNVGIFYGPLDYFMVITSVCIFCGHLVYFLSFWYVAPGKIWQPCSPSASLSYLGFKSVR